jgi:hypothetical protein
MYRPAPLFYTPAGSSVAVRQDMFCPDECERILDGQRRMSILLGFERERSATICQQYLSMYESICGAPGAAAEFPDQEHPS